MLPKDGNMVKKIIEKCAALYSTKPLICFVRKNQLQEIKTAEQSKDWTFYDSSQLRELININRGIHLLKPEKYRGFNTQFAINAFVLIGCPISSETQYHQMLGRGCRSRGICEGALYVNTGEDEAAFMRRIRTTNYSETVDMIEFLGHLEGLQGNVTKKMTVMKNGEQVEINQMVPGVRGLYKEYEASRLITSIKKLKEAAAEFTKKKDASE